LHRPPTSSSSSPSDAPSFASLVLRRNSKSFLIALPPSFDTAVDEAHKLFPKLDPDLVFLEREMSVVGWVRLTESGWELGTKASKEGEPVVLRVGEEEPSSEECDSEEDEKPAEKRVKVDFNDSHDRVPLLEDRQTMSAPWDGNVRLHVQTLTGKAVRSSLFFLHSVPIMFTALTLYAR
jgi:hypothetical protein